MLCFLFILAEKYYNCRKQGNWGSCKRYYVHW